MPKTSSIIILLLAALTLAACNQRFGGQFNSSKNCKIAFGLNGSISSITYTSPSNNFSVGIPDLGFDAECRDLDQGEGQAFNFSVQSWPVTCEKFEVGKQDIPKHLTFKDGQSFDLVLANINEKNKVEMKSRETVNTRFGMATYAYFLVDNFAPCVSFTYKDGKKVFNRDKAHIFGYWFEVDGNAYGVLLRKSDKSFGTRVNNSTDFMKENKSRVDAFFATLKIGQEI